MVYASRRRDWRARSPLAPRIGAVDELIVHTEAGALMPVGSTLKQERARMRAIDAFHLSLGWGNGFGYNAAVNPRSKAGRVHEGRGYRRAGAHTVGRNTRSQAVVLFGHGDRHGITTEAKAAIATWVREGQKTDVGAFTDHVRVNGHRDYAAKTCPGTKVTDADLADIARRIGMSAPTPEEDDVTPADRKAIADDVLDRMPKPPTADDVAGAVFARLQPKGGAPLGVEVDLERRQMRRHQRLLAWLIATVAAIAAERGLTVEPPDEGDADPIA